MDILDKMLAFELGELDNQGVLDLFGDLIRTGRAWTLQGFYGRTARTLIDTGWLDTDGNQLRELDEEE